MNASASGKPLEAGYQRGKNGRLEGGGGRAPQGSGK